MALSEDFLLELKRRNDIRSVVSSYVNLKGGGKNPKGLCPFHGEKTPSFTLYTDSDSFYCFGCSTGGDVVRFIMLIENLDYIEAVKFLAERSGMQMPVQGLDDGYSRIKNTVLAVNREAARFFHMFLMSPQGKVGYGYFKERRLADGTVKHFGLGFSPDSWESLTKHLRGKGYKDDELIAANVAVKGKNGGIYDRFRRRLMFPILDIRGNVIGFSGRKMPDDARAAKYVNTGDTPVFKKSHNLYGLNFAKNFCSEKLLVCEGQMDVIALHQAGFQNAVAPLGTALTQEQAQLIARYTREVILTMDSDAAGQKAADRAIDILNNSGVEVKILQIPSGKDPDEFMRSYGQEGPERFQALIEGAGNDVEYRLYKASAGCDLKTDEGRVVFLNKAAEVLSGINSPIEQDVYAGKLSEKYEVSKAAIMLQIQKLSKIKKREQYKKESRAAVIPRRRDELNPESISNPRAANAEEAILAILAKNPVFLEKAKPRLNAALFITAFNRRIFTVLKNRIESGLQLDLILMSGEFTGEELGKIAAIQAKEANRSNTASELLRLIGILEEEKQKKDASDLSSDDDFITVIKGIADKKRKGSL